MKLSSEGRRKKRVFDVDALQEKKHSSTKDHLEDLLYGKNVLNLKPKFRTRHPWIWSGAIVVVLVSIFFGLRQLSTRAEVQDFYPSSCLGNWQNSANAQGNPETLSAPGTSFSSDNSAMYASGTEIFCGGFLPSNFATSGIITNVGLTLVWQIGDAPTSTGIAPSSTEGVASSTSQASSTGNTNTPSSTDSSTASFAPTSTPNPNPTPTSSEIDTSDDSSTQTSVDSSADSLASSTGTSFLREIIPFAFADDEMDSSTVDSSTVSSASTTSSTVILGPPLIATLSTSTPSSSFGTATTTLSASNTTEIGPAPVPVPPPIPDNNFLDVSYSTDGQTWISIGKVNINNWQQFTVTLPISNWTDLQNLQIRLEGIPTTQDPIPPIYLDGMFAEVDYEVPPAITLPGDLGEGSSSLQQVVQVSSNVTITPPLLETAPTVPAPSITAITKTGDQVAVTVQYVGDFYGGNPLYMFVYPQGTTADRNDAGSAFTFAGQPQEGPSINALPIGENLLDTTTKQATITIVTPSPTDSSQIATGDMGSTTYAVDISYFDSQTWHLIQAQTFTWP